MKYMKRLTRYAREVEGFPYEDLKVVCDVDSVNGLATISWVKDGVKVTKVIAEMPTHMFRVWYPTSQANRRVKSILLREFTPYNEYPFDDQPIVSDSESSKTTIKVRAKPASKTYLFMKDGEEVIIHNLAAYCRDTGICVTHLRTLTRGLKESWHEWVFIRML